MNAVLQAQEPSAKYHSRSEHPLVRGFDLLATATGGVARLRALIVSLALGGRLTSRADGAVRIPSNAWPAVKLTELGPTFQNGVSSRGDVGGVPTTVIRLADIIAGEIDPADPRLLPIHPGDRAKYALRRGDILVIRVNGSADLVGRFIVCRSDMDAIHCDHFIRMRFDPTVALPEYLRLVGDSADVRAKVASLFVSTAGQKTVNQGHVGSITMRLPPLAEQHRIVARAEELMKLCDTLEQNGRLADEQHARLTSTLFDALAASESAHALAENWQRIAEHFDLLLDRPEAIDALEQTVLHLAIRGALVPQDLGDEPASALLYRLRTDRVESTDPEAVHEEATQSAPYDLPNSWAWAPLGFLVENMGSGWSPACDEGERSTSERWAVLRTTAVQVMEFRSREHKAIPAKLDGRPGIEVRPGDILITRAGPMNRVGISCWVDQTPPRLMLSDKIVRFHPTDEEMDPAFIVLTLNAGWTKIQLNAAKSGMAASQVNISQTDLRGIFLPVCSKSEQSRIVARVEELRHLCAQLRDRLTAARCTQTLLADALVRSAQRGE